MPRCRWRALRMACVGGGWWAWPPEKRQDPRGSGTRGRSQVAGTSSGLDSSDALPAAGSECRQLVLATPSRVRVSSSSRRRDLEDVDGHAAASAGQSSWRRCMLSSCCVGQCAGGGWSSCPIVHACPDGGGISNGEQAGQRRAGERRMGGSGSRSPPICMVPGRGRARASRAVSIACAHGTACRAGIATT